MGNVVLPVRVRGNFRPYGAAGAGLIHAWFSDGAQVYPDQNNLAFNAGGGVTYSLNDRVGLRADLRYFRALVDEDARDAGFFRDYGFWRAALGVALTLPR